MQQYGDMGRKIRTSAVNITPTVSISPNVIKKDYRIRLAGSSDPNRIHRHNGTLYQNIACIDYTR